jgi:hypothetical protein
MTPDIFIRASISQVKETQHQLKKSNHYQSLKSHQTIGSLKLMGFFLSVEIIIKKTLSMNSNPSFSRKH